MDLSIIIVNWNTCELLAQCLTSIYAFPPAGDFEAIVVDNASADSSVAMIRERFPQVFLIENRENVGYARANNQGIETALLSGKHALLLNSDTEVCCGALEGLQQALIGLPHVGAVGPMMLNPDGSQQSSYGSLPSVTEEVIGPYLRDQLFRPWGRIGRHFVLEESGRYKRVQRVSFACTLVRLEAIQDVGLLDESFAFYSEDYDFFKRLDDAGWDVLYCPSSQVYHHWGASSGQRSEWALRQLYRSKRIYYQKHYGIVTRRKLDLGLKLRFSAKLLFAPFFSSLRRQEYGDIVRLNHILLSELQHDPFHTH